MSVPAFTLPGLTLAGERVWYWITGGALVAAVWIALNLIDSPAGRAV